jgi:haloalkane dehalogenase
MLHVSHPPISTEEISYRKYVPVLDTQMAYVDVGAGDPIVFLHGNPTPSYLWRNIIPYLLPHGRCLAPDYVGMGNSGAAPDGSYRFVDHRRYLDAWFDALGLDKNVILVVHDFGSVLGFDWARRHPDRVKAIVYMEGIVRPFRSWDEWPDLTRAFFQAHRGEQGEEMILQKDLFIEYMLPLRHISKEALEVYRRYYRIPGPSRQPILSWTRELPIAGETRRRRRHRRGLCKVAVGQSDPKTLHRCRAGRLPDRRAARVLSGVAQSGDRAGKGGPLPAGGGARGGRRRHRPLRLEGAGRPDQLDAEQQPRSIRLVAG